MSKLNFASRKAIQKGLQENKTYREMAADLAVSKSAIAYEIKHHSLYSGLYDAERAQWESLNNPLFLVVGVHSLGVIPNHGGDLR